MCHVTVCSVHTQEPIVDTTILFEGPRRLTCISTLLRTHPLLDVTFQLTMQAAKFYQIYGRKIIPKFRLLNDSIAQDPKYAVL